MFWGTMPGLPGGGLYYQRLLRVTWLFGHHDSWMHLPVEFVKREAPWEAVEAVVGSSA